MLFKVALVDTISTISNLSFFIGLFQAIAFNTENQEFKSFPVFLDFFVFLAEDEIFNPSMIVINRSIKWNLVSIRIVRFLLHELLTFGKTFRSWRDKENQRLLAIDYDQIAELYLANTEIIIESLENLKGIYKSSLISFMQESRLRETSHITSGAFVERVINRIKPK